MRARQSRPSVARVYSYVLGGRDNYGVDKNVGDYFMGDLPGSEQLAITNREAVLRAVHSMASDGIRQFIDMGCGLPATENVHDVARRVHPDAKVVYVDNDPFVVAHGRALLAVDEGIDAIEGDVGKTAWIREHPAVQRLIDFEQPVGILFAVTLSFLEDDEDPAGVVKFWTDQIPSESRIYISHFRTGGTREAQATERKILEAFGRGSWRTDEDIRSFYGDLEILDPGIVPCAKWRPAPGKGEHVLTDWEEMIVAGLARKP
ncbi:SAM-dependent methyltransferase [Nocardia sp. SYP-A9097]|uniref:SAM-dependent methyltransferase n=1 Tax=Nocardia sp. SYP-A9097 TaxID=2663237 RepID=UPI00129B69A9|nr:SAM-dependent methyltransferase [Nocardia sp. SYP-A9097]MRH90537.1 SAM-dependent methyltransferase [Nocardia sp. SYP-A9097]